MIENFCTCCGITLPKIDTLTEKVTLIGTMGFMDGYTFDWKRAIKCCIHELRPDNKYHFVFIIIYIEVKNNY